MDEKRAKERKREERGRKERMPDYVSISDRELTSTSWGNTLQKVSSAKLNFMLSLAHFLF